MNDAVKRLLLCVCLLLPLACSDSGKKPTGNGTASGAGARSKPSQASALREGSSQNPAKTSSCDARSSGSGHLSPVVSQPPARQPQTQPNPVEEGGERNHWVNCDKFEANAILKVDRVELTLDTDLPADTVVMLSAGRTYREKGNPSNYVIDYFSRKLRVDDLRAKPVIGIGSVFPLSDKDAMAQFEAKRDKLATIGLAGHIESISDYINIDIVVPVNQPNPAFGRMNASLRGRKVETGISGLRVIEWHKGFLRPLGKTPAAQPRLADPQALAVNLEYRLSKRTPLMPEFEPRDPLEAIGRMRHIPAGGQINVVSVRKKRGYTWYQVKATDGAGKGLGMGWINATALLGQDVAIIRKPEPRSARANTARTQSASGPAAEGKDKRTEQTQGETTRDKEAQSRLSLAKNYLANGLTDKGRKFLSEIIRDFPETTAAQEAKGMLEKE